MEGGDAVERRGRAGTRVASSLCSPRSSLRHWPRYDCCWGIACSATEPSWGVLGEKLYCAREVRMPGRANVAVVSHHWRSPHHRFGSREAAVDWPLLEVRGWAAWDGGQECWMLAWSDYLSLPL